MNRSNSFWLANAGPFIYNYSLKNANMMPALFILSFILNSMGTAAITYLGYYRYKYRAKNLSYLLASLGGLLCLGVSYSFYLVYLSSTPFEQFKTVFFLFFSLGMLAFTLFFYLYISKKFLLRTFRLTTILLFIFCSLSLVLALLAIFFPPAWYISLGLSLFTFVFASFLTFNQLLFLQNKLEVEIPIFRLLAINFLLLAIGIAGEIIYFFITRKVSSFSPLLCLLLAFFFFLILKNRSLYYQKQEIENPEKVRTLLEQFSLSAKEQEIAMQLLQGKSNKEISFDMEISNSTVKSHVYSIYKKVHVQSRVQFVNLVTQRG